MDKKRILNRICINLFKRKFIATFAIIIPIGTLFFTMQDVKDVLILEAKIHISQINVSKYFIKDEISNESLYSARYLNIFYPEHIYFSETRLKKLIDKPREFTSTLKFVARNPGMSEQFLFIKMQGKDREMLLKDFNLLFDEEIINPSREKFERIMNQLHSKRNEVVSLIELVNGLLQSANSNINSITTASNYLFLYNQLKELESSRINLDDALMEENSFLAKIEDELQIYNISSFDKIGLTLFASTILLVFSLLFLIATFRINET